MTATSGAAAALPVPSLFVRTITRLTPPPLRAPSRLLSRLLPYALLHLGARRIAGALRVLRTVLGAPDYDRYVAHCRARGTGSDGAPVRDVPVLDRAAFERERLAARYDRPGSRCC